MATKTKKKELTKRQWILIVNKLKKEGATNHKSPRVKMGQNKVSMWALVDSFDDIRRKMRWQCSDHNLRWYHSTPLTNLFWDTMNSMCLEDQRDFARTIATYML